MKKHIHFPGLNGLRFLAAFAVMFGHTESFKKTNGLANLYHHSFIHSMGARGVELFFVLSGFLITYLLLSEMNKTNRIDLKKFWVRRILRIWPLYFFVVFLGFVVVPLFISFPPLSEGVKDGTFYKLILFVGMLPNLILAKFPSMLGLSVLWSIGVEEQFYLTWPVLLKKFRKNLGKILISIIVILVMLRLFINLKFGFIYHYEVRGEILGFKARTLSIFFNTLKFECMALGALMALFVFEQKKTFLKVLYSKKVQIINLIVLTVLLWFGIYFYFLNSFVYGVLFSILILNVSTNEKSFVKLESQVFRFMGKISYGLYMYHSFLIAIFIILFRDLLEKNVIFGNVVLYFFVTLGTSLTAYLSYKYFEMPFLRKKKSYEVVASTN